MTPASWIASAGDHEETFCPLEENLKLNISKTGDLDFRKNQKPPTQFATLGGGWRLWTGKISWGFTFIQTICKWLRIQPQDSKYTHLRNSRITIYVFIVESLIGLFIITMEYFYSILFSVTSLLGIMAPLASWTICFSEFVCDVSLSIINLNPVISLHPHTDPD